MTTLSQWNSSHISPLHLLTQQPLALTNQENTLCAAVVSQVVEPWTKSLKGPGSNPTHSQVLLLLRES